MTGRGCAFEATTRARKVPQFKAALPVDGRAPKRGAFSAVAAKQRVLQSKRPLICDL